MPDYLRFVLQIIQNEKSWIENYFDKRTVTEIINSLERVLISEHLLQILERGYHEMFTEAQIDILSLLFDFAESA
jgi:hypothetical protein